MDEAMRWENKLPKVSWKMGEVLWFDEYRGEGQIRTDDGEKYYFHYSSIDSSEKWKTLADDTRVKFHPSADHRRKHAARVKKL